MKKYKNPEIEAIELKETDVITTSPGTETTPQDETDGSWQIGVNM